jgi:hypothetical protein
MVNPPTSYILRGIKELYMQKTDPSVLGNTLINGLKEKENQLKRFTHESLAKAIPNYIEQEAYVATFMGDNYIKFLLGLIGPNEMTQTPPTVIFSDFSPMPDSSSSSSSSSLSQIVIHAGTEYYLEAIISGGNMNLDGFTYEWTIDVVPEKGGTVLFRELINIKTPDFWTIGTGITFTEPLLVIDEPGDYVIRLTVTNTLIPAVRSMNTATASVVV